MNEQSAAPSGAIDPEYHLWQPWTPAQAASALAGVDAPWYVAAGWAISLFLGEEHRHHDDLEVGVPARASTSSHTGCQITTYSSPADSTTRDTSGRSKAPKDR